MIQNCTKYMCLMGALALSLSGCDKGDHPLGMSDEIASENTKITSGVLQCGSTNYTYEGKSYSRQIAYKLDVINEQLSQLPVLQEKLGTNVVETCELAKLFNENVALYENRDLKFSDKVFQRPIEEVIERPSPQVAAKRGGDVSIRRGGVVAYEQGVVEIILYSPGGWSHCTGTMINSNSILTAAHCMKNVWYEAGNQAQVWLKAEYFDPDIGAKRQITSGAANEMVLATAFVSAQYTGSGDYADDVGIITLNSGGWIDTDSGDWVRIMEENPSIISERIIDLYGQGHPDGQGTLRTAEMTMHYNANYMQAYSTTWPVIEVCQGDSGGPYKSQKSWFGSSGSSDVIISVMSWLHSTPCTSFTSNPATSNHIDFIESSLGMTCKRWGSGTHSYDYIRCW